MLNLIALSGRKFTDCWDFRKLNKQPRTRPMAIEVMVTMTNQIGMIHNSFSFSNERRAVDTCVCSRNKSDVPGVKKKATFENRRAGVKSETFSLLIC